MLAATVPGAPKGWSEMVERHGNLTLAEVLQPAIELAEKGFVLSAGVAGTISGQVNQLGIYEPWYDTFFYKDRAWREGEILVNRDLARTYRRLAFDGAETLYTGDLAHEIIDFMEAEGGIWALEDLANYEVQWKEPIHTTYRGYDVFGAPPTSSSITWMQTLNILEGYDVEAMGHNSADYLHTLLEAHKRAHVDGYTYVADPNFVDVPVERLLSKEYAAEIRSQISPDKAWNPTFYPDGYVSRPVGEEMAWDGFSNIDPLNKATTHFVTIDADGNMVSVTETLGAFFGAGPVVRGTGAALSNGMSWFDLTTGIFTGKKSNNIVEGGKRNRWTLSPGIVLKDGKPFIGIGGSGGDVTQLGITQPIVNMIDFGMNVEAALNAPRAVWSTMSSSNPVNEVQLYHMITDDVRADLEARGHEIIPREFAPRPFGGGTTAGSVVDEALFGAEISAGY